MTTKTFIPCYYRIVDELLMNAVDNHTRSNTKVLRVDIEKNGYITVENDGKNIPIEIHEKEQVYVPELVFGNLLTGSNFDDKEIKFVGGRNGYGKILN
jgi:DNA topoisomerase II